MLCRCYVFKMTCASFQSTTSRNWASECDPISQRYTCRVVHVRISLSVHVYKLGCGLYTCTAVAKLENVALLIKLSDTRHVENSYIKYEHPNDQYFTCI